MLTFFFLLVCETKQMLETNIQYLHNFFSKSEYSQSESGMQTQSKSNKCAPTIFDFEKVLTDRKRLLPQEISYVNVCKFFPASNERWAQGKIDQWQ
jgi:hypothetical protein